MLSVDFPVVTMLKVVPNHGSQHEVEEWFRKIGEKAFHFDGFLKSEIFRTLSRESTTEVLCIFTFNSSATLMIWENSKDRNELFAEGRTLFVESQGRQRLTGMEILVHETGPQPAVPQKWKMLVMTSLAIFLLLNTVVVWTQRVFNIIGAPAWLWSIFSVVFLGYLMTYWLMPFLTRSLSRWLFGPPSRFV